MFISNKHQQIEQLFKQLKFGLEQYMTADQKRHCQKLSIIYKDLVKNQKVLLCAIQDLGIDDSPNFFTSLNIQLFQLKQDILNNNKLTMSDYEAFEWKFQLYQQKKDMFTFFEKNQLMSQLTLPKRAITLTPLPSVKDMKQLGFCPLGHSIENIVQFSLGILYENSYCQKMFSREVMAKFVGQLARQYHIVSYHNFTHAFSLQLMLFHCTEKSQKLRDTFSPFQTFISYVSALAHDIGHCKFFFYQDGTNSDFQIKKKSQIAQLYSNQSVLENMHVAKFCRMLRKYPEIDIIQQITDPVERQRSKRLIIRLILGTDVTKHFQNLTRLQSLTLPKQVSQLSLTQKQFLHQNLFHACDIGNCCLEYEDFMNWAILLSYEFNSQYQLQERLGLQKSQMFRYDGEMKFYKGQVGFVDVLALPLWRQIAGVFDQLEGMVGNVERNKQKLKEKAKTKALQDETKS